MASVVCAPQWTITSSGPSEEELGDAHPLVGVQQDPLAGRAEREDAVEPAAVEEVEVGREDSLVEREPTVAERCQGCSVGPCHGETLSCATMSALRITRDGAVLRVTLAKPERRNAFDAALIAELHEAFSDVGEARVVVLAGDGPTLLRRRGRRLAARVDRPHLRRERRGRARLYRMLEAVDSCAAPVVVRIHGYALGGGSGLAACGDAVVAAPDATFGFTEVRLGIIPAVISPFVFAKTGAGSVRRFFQSGERFGADAALRLGLVDEIAEDLDLAVERVAGEILKSGPEATRAAKRLVREHPSDPGELARIAAGLRAGEEGQEGLRAFLERREPSWLH